MQWILSFSLRFEWPLEGGSRFLALDPTWIPPRSHRGAHPTYATDRGRAVGRAVDPSVGPSIELAERRSLVQTEQCIKF